MMLDKFKIHTEIRYPMVSDSRFSDQILFYTEIDNGSEVSEIESLLKDREIWLENWDYIMTIENHGYFPEEIQVNYEGYSQVWVWKLSSPLKSRVYWIVITKEPVAI